MGVTRPDAGPPDPQELIRARLVESGAVGGKRPSQDVPAANEITIAELDARDAELRRQPAAADQSAAPTAPTPSAPATPTSPAPEGPGLLRRAWDFVTGKHVAAQAKAGSAQVQSAKVDPVAYSREELVARASRSRTINRLGALSRWRDQGQYLANRTDPDRRGASGSNISTALAMPLSSKAFVTVLPLGSEVDEAAPEYTDFILTNIAEMDVEKTEIVETFGGFHVFASGRFAQKYQFSGMVRCSLGRPLNAADPDSPRGAPASVLLRNLYEQHLRATTQAERQTFTRISVDGDTYDGWITNYTLNRDSQSEFLAPFTLTMVAFRRRHASDASAKRQLSAFGRVKGSRTRPLSVLKAQKALAQGDCEPEFVDVPTSITVTLDKPSDFGKFAELKARAKTGLGRVQFSATIDGKDVTAALGLLAQSTLTSTATKICTAKPSVMALLELDLGELGESRTLKVDLKAKGSSKEATATVSLVLDATKLPPVKVSAVRIGGTTAAAGATVPDYAATFEAAGSAITWTTTTTTIQVAYVSDSETPLSAEKLKTLFEKNKQKMDAVPEIYAGDAKAPAGTPFRFGSYLARVSVTPDGLTLEYAASVHTSSSSINMGGATLQNSPHITRLALIPPPVNRDSKKTLIGITYTADSGKAFASVTPLVFTTASTASCRLTYGPLKAAAIAALKSLQFIATPADNRMLLVRWTTATATLEAYDDLDVEGDKIEVSSVWSDTDKGTYTGSSVDKDDGIGVEIKLDFLDKVNLKGAKLNVEVFGLPPALGGVLKSTT